MLNVTQMGTCIYIYMSVDQNRMLSRGRPPVRSLCRGRLLRRMLQTLCRRISCGYDSTYYPEVALCFWRFVAEGFVPEHARLLQTCVAKWPPKPVTNPILLIRCHIYIYMYKYVSHLYVHGSSQTSLQRGPCWKIRGFGGSQSYDPELWHIRGFS